MQAFLTFLLIIVVTAALATFLIAAAAVTIFCYAAESIQQRRHKKQATAPAKPADPRRRCSECKERETCPLQAFLEINRLEEAP